MKKFIALIILGFSTLCFADGNATFSYTGAETLVKYNVCLQDDADPANRGPCIMSSTVGPIANLDVVMPDGDWCVSVSSTVSITVPSTQELDSAFTAPFCFNQFTLIPQVPTFNGITPLGDVPGSLVFITPK